MSQYLREVDTSFTAFSAQWPVDAAVAKAALDGETQRFLSSYRRLVSLQAWREHFLSSHLSAGSLQFFLEAQNDALLSHLAARSGVWRGGLQCLRSCIENILTCLFYKDHPIELLLWQKGKHRPGFSELHTYFSNHPHLTGIPLADAGLDSLKSEYATLSKAVHASAEIFRMTQGAAVPTLWSSDPTRLSKWASREAAVLRSVNLLLLSLFREDLRGTQHRLIRQAASLVIARSSHTRLLQSLGVRLIAV